MTDARKRAQAIMRKHVIGADVFDLHIDAMLAFAAEERKAERERCVRIINDMDLASYPYTKHFGSEYIAAIERTDDGRCVAPPCKCDEKNRTVCAYWHKKVATERTDNESTKN